MSTAYPHPSEFDPFFQVWFGCVELGLGKDETKAYIRYEAILDDEVEEVLLECPRENLPKVLEGVMFQAYHLSVSPAQLEAMMAEEI